MKRILMRAGKSPFDAVSPYGTFAKNVIGSNNGNLIFGAAAHKLFSVAGAEVAPNNYRINGAMADSVNDEYDGFVLPLANAFRPSFEPELQRTAEFIERLRIPFIMVSGGAQLDLDGSHDSLKPMEATVRRFAKAVLSKSSALSVRGERTASYLQSLGFNDVIVVGCPSMTMNGPGHVVHKNSSVLDEKSQVAYNIETSIDLLGDVIASNSDRYNMTYFPQDIKTMELMLWGVDKYPATRDGRLPLRSSHPQISQGKAKFYVDAPTWIQKMGDYALSFGPRIHGNIAAILAGTPAVVIAHDSRTLELADYHSIPRMLPKDLQPNMDVADIFQFADYTEFNRGHAERFDRLGRFIKENGFSHIYEADQAPAREEYEAKLARVEFPPPLTTVWSGQDDFQRERLVIQRTSEVEHREVVARLRRDLTAAVGRIKKLEAANADLKRVFANQN
ncbi:hypothetical protein QFZ65_001695 [Arthrobacter sp. B3I9]|uniref:polysaccharide pyruvyl transferase family protein n=1 Tax=Arthrobacter sp. B3I9 TaxID=3042270 RepID=UPI002793F7C1|nr:polysaccharide pyruvyl transferase family protein [Arthrobacter sp. B3I9]MDQ0849757.1 hypothetical protein [Arthrobacter sp. B3I9]